MTDSYYLTQYRISEVNKNSAPFFSDLFETSGGFQVDDGTVDFQLEGQLHIRNDAYRKT